MGLTKNNGAESIEVSEQKERVIIFTKSGKKFEIIINDEDSISVYASTGIGSGLVVKPHSNNCIVLRQDKI